MNEQKLNEFLDAQDKEIDKIAQLVKEMCRTDTWVWDGLEIEMKHEMENGFPTMMEIFEMVLKNN